MQKLKILDDSLEQIKKHPRMYLDNSEPTGHLLSELLLEDANILQAKNVNLEEIDGWFMLFSERDWLSKNKQNLSLIQLFNQLTPFPEAGANSIRHEVVLMAFASNISIYYHDSLSKIKGNELPQKIQNFIKTKDKNINFAIVFNID